MSGFQNLIVDTGFLVGMVSSKDKFHQPCLLTFRQHSKQTRYYSVESCLSEACFILGELRAVEQLERMIQVMPLEIVALSGAEVSRVFELMRKYASLPMDFADAALVAIAERLDVDTILTTDKRDFNVYRPKHVSHFKIAP